MGFDDFDIGGRGRDCWRRSNWWKWREESGSRSRGRSLIGATMEQRAPLLLVYTSDATTFEGLRRSTVAFVTFAVITLSAANQKGS